MQNRSGVALTGWLLKNELRLWWRKTTGVKHFWIWMVVLWLFLAFVFVSFWFGFSPVRLATAEAELPAEALWVAAGLWLLGFVFAFNQSVGESVVVLFERGDLDLLLASPVPGRAIFSVRLLCVAFCTFFSFCMVVVPASLLAVFLGFSELLGLYPTLVGICLVTASLGMLVTLRIVRWVGARRARVLVQILNLFVSLMIVLSFQVPNFLLSSGVDLSNFWDWLQSQAMPGSFLGIDSWIWFPARAMLLDGASVGLTLGVSSAIAAFTVYALEQAFVEGTQQSVARKRRARGGKNATLRDGFVWVVLTKEWRTMRRHPYLISQVALQVVLVLPLTWLLLQGEGGSNPLLDLGRVANVAMPFLGGQLAYVLTFACLSGEEAADLLKASPAASAHLRRLKQLAALIPVWLLLLPAIAALIWQGYNWFPAVVAAAGASVGSSFFRLWNSQPVRAGELFRQRKLGKTDLLLTVMEVSSPWAWVSLGSALYAGSVAFTILSAVGIAVLLSLGYWRGRALGSALHY